MAGPQNPNALDSAVSGAASQSNASTDSFCAVCASENWIKLRYEYEDGTGVPGAAFVVQEMTDNGTPTGNILAEGFTDDEGNAEVELPSGHSTVEYYFHADPEGDPYEEPQVEHAINEPEPGFFDRLWQSLADAGEWTLGVLKGDFEEDPSTSQIIVRMILTMIPVIDQIADAQDIVHILYKLIWKREWNVPSHWILLVITLIGLIPTLGSLAKGVLKLVWKKADDLLGLYRVFNFFKKGHAHRWLRDFATDLTGKHLDEVKALLDRLMNRVLLYLEKSKSWVGHLTGKNALLEQASGYVIEFMHAAPAYLTEAATTLQKRLLDALAKGMTRIRRVATRNTEPHITKQQKQAPPNKLHYDPFDGTPYTKAEYDDYVARKTAAGETPRTPEEYVAARDHWRKGGAAHQAEVDKAVERLEEAFPDARVEQTPSLVNAKGDRTYPDIMVIDDDTGKATFYEVKTGGAELTSNQADFASNLRDATFTDAQAQRLGLRDPKMTLEDLFPGGISFEEIRGPGYKE